MKEISPKLPPKKTKAVAALLRERTIQKAAESVGIGTSTLHRWLTEKEFQAVYQENKKLIVSHAISPLQNATGEAVDALIEVIRGKKSHVSAKVTSSKVILELSMKGIELEELQQRVAAIEKLIEEKKL